jgi:phosphotriesterase-related protein
VTVGFESFGQEFYFSPDWEPTPDNQKLRTLAELVNRGFAQQIVLGLDTCMKGQLKTFGGMGYDHLLRRVTPRLCNLYRVGAQELDVMLVGNPRRLLERPNDLFGVVDAFHPM